MKKERKVTFPLRFDRAEWIDIGCEAARQGLSKNKYLHKLIKEGRIIRGYAVV